MLLLTFDEDDRNAANHIATIFVGQPIIHGHYSEAVIERSPGSGVDHFNILRTIERRYPLGVCNAANDGARKPIANIFRTAPGATAECLDPVTQANAKATIIRKDSFGIHEARK